MTFDEDTQAQLAQLRQERGIHIRRLGKLKEQQARLGGETPPAVAMEIEDVQAMIDTLGSRISTLESAALIQEKRKILIGDSPIDPALKDLWHYVLGLEDDLRKQIKAVLHLIDAKAAETDTKRAAGQLSTRRLVAFAIVLLLAIALRVWLWPLN